MTLLQAITIVPKMALIFAKGVGLALQTVSLIVSHKMTIQMAITTVLRMDQKSANLVGMARNVRHIACQAVMTKEDILVPIMVLEFALKTGLESGAIFQS